MTSQLSGKAVWLYDSLANDTLTSSLDAFIYKPLNCFVSKSKLLQTTALSCSCTIYSYSLLFVLCTT